MYIRTNPNPTGRRTNDCVIRAIAIVLDSDWGTVFKALAREGLRLHEVMDANHLWVRWLERHGFRLLAIPNTCPDCYTVRDFCTDHPRGRYVLGTGDHAVAAIDGNWYDTFDSGDLVPIFCLRRWEDGI